MKITYNWLKEYVDFDWSVEELAERRKGRRASSLSAAAELPVWFAHDDGPGNRGLVA